MSEEIPTLPVFDDTPLICQACGSRTEKCSFCDEPARHMLGANVLSHESDAEWKRVDATIYICENHETMFEQSLLDGEYEDATVELGMYTPNEDCSGCDPWA